MLDNKQSGNTKYAPTHLETMLLAVLQRQLFQFYFPVPSFYVRPQMELNVKDVYLKHFCLHLSESLSLNH